MQKLLRGLSLRAAAGHRVQAVRHVCSWPGPIWEFAHSVTLPAAGKRSMPLTGRSQTCDDCGAAHDCDHNAAGTLNDWAV